jgi:hypothetical protein
MCLHRGSAKCEFEKREARSQSQAAGGKTYRRVSGLFRSVPCPVRAAPLAAVIPSYVPAVAGDTGGSASGPSSGGSMKLAPAPPGPGPLPGTAHRSS